MNQPRQAITTTYKTNSKGHGYIMVKASAGRLRVDWDSALCIESNHYQAGMVLVRKYGWDKYNDYIIGTLDSDYVLVAIEKDR